MGSVPQAGHRDGHYQVGKVSQEQGPLPPSCWRSLSPYLSLPRTVRLPVNLGLETNLVPLVLCTGIPGPCSSGRKFQLTWVSAGGSFSCLDLHPGFPYRLDRIFQGSIGTFAGRKKTTLGNSLLQTFPFLCLFVDVLFGLFHFVPRENNLTPFSFVWSWET